MTLKNNLVFWAPLAVAVFGVTALLLTSPEPSVRNGIVAGLALALLQSYLSTAALIWAWNKPIFYWVWGSGILIRLLILAATAFIVAHTGLSLVATLAVMIFASTLFTVLESTVFVSKPV